MVVVGLALVGRRLYSVLACRTYREDMLLQTVSSLSDDSRVGFLFLDTGYQFSLGSGSLLDAHAKGPRGLVLLSTPISDVRPSCSIFPNEQYVTVLLVAVGLHFLKVLLLWIFRNSIVYLTGVGWLLKSSFEFYRAIIVQRNLNDHCKIKWIVLMVKCADISYFEF